MLKKTVTFEDYNEPPVEVTEDFYFNLTKLELIEMEVEYDGGLQELMRGIVEAEDAKAAYDIFKKILLRSYGRRSEDGKFFLKSEVQTQEFEGSPALAEIILEMLANPAEGAKFIEQVLPKKLVDEALADQKKIEEAKDAPVAPTLVPQTITEIKDKKPSEMTREELLQAFKDRSKGE